jgi:hypothetical protein
MKANGSPMKQGVSRQSESEGRLTTMLNCGRNPFGGVRGVVGIPSASFPTGFACGRRSRRDSSSQTQAGLRLYRCPACPVPQQSKACFLIERSRPEVHASDMLAYRKRNGGQVDAAAKRLFAEKQGLISITHKFGINNMASCPKNEYLPSDNLQLGGVLNYPV